jgi:hypothetical protein
VGMFHRRRDGPNFGMAAPNLDHLAVLAPPRGARVVFSCELQI